MKILLQYACVIGGTMLMVNAAKMLGAVFVFSNPGTILFILGHAIVFGGIWLAVKDAFKNREDSND